MRHRVIVALILSLVFAAAAGAQTFTWIGWFGQEWTDPAWGGQWTWDNQLMENGWGHQWYWYEDPAPHFPDLTSEVFIPDGAVVDTDGGSDPYCGALTVGVGALFQAQYTNVEIGGPTLHNDGVVLLTAGSGAVSGFHLHGALAIEGDGEIQLAPGRFHSDTPGMALTVGAGQLVYGGGFFGSEPYGNYHGLAITNVGRIRASSPTSPLILLSLPGINRGTLEAAAGAELRLAGDWDNAGGEILAADGVVWLIPDAAHPARIDGGTLRTTGTGEIRPEADGSLKNVTLEGTLHLRRYTSVHMSDTITNNGYIKQGVDGWAGYATVYVDSALTFLGDGLLRMGAANDIKMHQWPAGFARVTNGPDHVIELVGGRFGELPNYYGDQRVELVNEGTILCKESPYACEFRVAGVGFENRGLLVLEPAASVDPAVWGPFLQTAGKLECDDVFRANDGGFTITGGVLAGRAGLAGAVEASGGAVIRPGDEGEIGTLHVWGPLTLGDGAELDWEWSAYGQDLLQVHGAVTAAGALTLRVIDPTLAPDKSVDHVVLTCESHDDQAAWTVETPAGWTYDTLEWVGNDLVLRGLSDTPTAAAGAPRATGLMAAAPNPFNPRTEIRFALEREGRVRLWVADLGGRRVATLVDDVRSAGVWKAAWDGRDADGRALGAGLYLAVFEAEGRRESRRLTLVR